MILYIYFEMLMVFLGVVFITVLERKILGLMQFRVGPNKIFYKGLIQSMGDAMKLMSKSNLNLYFINMLEYNFLPVGMLLVMMILWMFMPGMLMDFTNSMLIMICILSIGVYPIMFGSWFSGSLYSMLGSIRSIAQMISYEVSMIMILISFMIFMGTFNLYNFWMGGLGVVFVFLFIMLLLMMFSMLVELGRSPMDLLEGESELVSGFNTEYFGMKFALVFLAEYGMVMFLGGLISSLCWGFKSFSLYWSMTSMLLVIMVFWIRGIMPRIRYDQLMMVCWVSVLNLSLGILIINMGYVSIW